MNYLNRYLRNLKPYVLASHKVWTVSPFERKEILKLDWNEATIPPSPKVKKRLLELLQEPDWFHLYPSTYNEPLLNALADYIGISIKNVQYFASSDSLHEYVCKLYVSVGDPVLILGPTYDNFRLTCQANGAQVYFSEYNPDFTLNEQRFEDDIRCFSPSLVYICNPNNPTGYCHSAEYIEHLLKEFPEALFLIDEAYCEFSGITATPLVNKYENIIISRTMSKAFALANFRFGYVVAPEKIILQINRIRNPKNISTITQEAALAALQDLEYMREYVQEVNRAKKDFFAFINKYEKCEAFWSYGNFILLKMDSEDEKIRLMQYLEEHLIFTRNTAQSRLLDRCFRISVGTGSQMHKVAKTIQSFYND